MEIAAGMKLDGNQKTRQRKAEVLAVLEKVMVGLKKAAAGEVAMRVGIVVDQEMVMTTKAKSQTPIRCQMRPQKKRNPGNE
jgi:hypothetical protein